MRERDAHTARRAHDELRGARDGEDAPRAADHEQLVAAPMHQQRGNDLARGSAAQRGA
jgi:hypothetical protein